MNVGCGRDHGVNETALAIDADVSLHSEKPLVPFPGGVHLGIALLVFVLGRTRRMDDRCINDRATPHGHTRTTQVRVNGPKDTLPKTMLLQEMTELANRRLVRNPFASEIDADERPHRGTVVECLLHGRIAKVEPVLQEVHAQHSLDAYRRSSRPISRRIVSVDDFAETLPWDHLVHLIEKPGTPRRLAVAFKTGGCKRDLLVRHGQILS